MPLALSRGIHCTGSTRVRPKDIQMTDLQTAPAGTDYPGKTLGIVGLIVAIFFNVIGVIISAIALNQSKQAGYKNGLAKAGIIVGAVLFALGLIGGIIAAVVIGSLGAATYSTY
jgi:hypothetical protein